jgi:hypothetical protein
LAGAIALSCLSISPPPAVAQDVPDFIEVGKRYMFGVAGMMDMDEGAEVVEIGPGSWVKVRFPEFDQPVWLNLEMVAVLVEVTPEFEAYMEEEDRSLRERAYQAAMKSDLRNLVTAEEAHFADNMSYTEALDDLYFTPSSGVSIENLVVAEDGNGWSAIARHEQSSVTCAIYVGSGEPPMEDMREGVPVCK